MGWADLLHQSIPSVGQSKTSAQQRSTEPGADPNPSCCFIQTPIQRFVLQEKKIIPISFLTLKPLLLTHDIQNQLLSHHLYNQPHLDLPAAGRNGVLAARGHRSKDSPLGQSPGTVPSTNPAQRPPPRWLRRAGVTPQWDPDAGASHCPAPSQRENHGRQTRTSNNHTILRALHTVYFSLSFLAGREGN